MQFTQEITSEGPVIALAGPFTFKDHHSFRALLDLLKASDTARYVLDLSRLEFLDSAALGMLLIADDEARGAGRSLTLRRPPTQIARLMELAAMDTLFTIEP
jgi:anti-anti-sigma factor